MNDGVYFDQNGNEVIVINGFEYSREEFDSKEINNDETVQNQ